MNRFLFFAVVATLFAACSEDGVNEISNDRGHAIPSVLYASIDTEDETRMQLDELQKTVWTEGDLVSVFYYCNGNTPFEFKGKTGDRDGRLGVLSLVEGDTEIDKIVSIYPYSEEYTMNTTKKYVSVKLPATQHYLEGSYGVGDNLMAYVGDDDSNLSHKNLCGWIKIQLKGSGIVTKITLKGNDGEQLAGDAKFYYEDFRLKTLDQGGLAIGEYIETITLDCGNGVTLDAETPTEFYFVVAPHTFAKGITIEATCSDGTVMTKSTSNKLTVERNHIKPMVALPVDATILVNNEIWYTNGSTTEPTAPNDPAAFGDATIQSNTYDAEKECWVITFDKDVTEIGERAFFNCKSLTSVTIPDSVTTIGEEAFLYCNSLTSVTIPNSVTTIGVCAFTGCRWLKEFKSNLATDDGRCLIIDNTIIAYAHGSGSSYTIPDGVIAIGDYAFYYCYALESIIIPDSVKKIGDKAFYGCGLAKGVTIGNGVIEIGISAFAICNFVNFTIPDNVTTIGDRAFILCHGLKEFKGKFAADGGRCLIIDGVLNAFAIGCGVTQYTIPDSVITIGNDVFRGCDSLTSVTIPDSVTTIGYCAFYECNSLATVYCKRTTPPTGGGSMFDDNASGRKIYVPASDDDSIINAYKAKYRWSDYADYIFEDEPKPANNEIWYTNGSTTAPTAPNSTTAFGSATIQSNSYDAEKKCWVITFDKYVTEIGNGAFSDCDSLTSVTIPDSITTIGERAFSYCYMLTSVTIPDSVTTIGDYAFQECYSLTSVTIGNSVTTIGYGAFKYCRSLTSVTIPNSVTTIGGEAFCYCESLATVYCKPTNPPKGVGIYTFDDNAAGRIIFVPASEDDSIINAYKKASGWREYKYYIFEEE